jgi:hypothetical protein
MIDFHSPMFSLFDKFDNGEFIKIFYDYNNEKSYKPNNKFIEEEDLLNFIDKNYSNEFKLDKNQSNLFFKSLVNFENELKLNNYLPTLKNIKYF